MKREKIMRLICSTFFVFCLSVTNISAKETNRNISPRYGSFVTCSYSFSNYTTLPSNPTYECYIGTNGGIGITINPNVSSSKYTMSFELVKDGIRTKNIKTVSMVKGNRISWGELPSGKYQVRVTSTYSNYDTDKRAVGTFEIYYGD